MHIAQFPLSVNIKGELIDKTGRVVASPSEGFEDIFTEMKNMDIWDVFDFVTEDDDIFAHNKQPMFCSNGVFEPNIEDEEDDDWDEEDEDDY